MKKTISAVVTRRVISGAMGAVLLSTAGSAFAQPKAAAPKAAVATTSASSSSSSSNGDYGYTFLDDNLGGTSMASSDSVIHAGRFLDRSNLIRPRTTFVQEMLKSVENL